MTRSIHWTGRDLEMAERLDWGDGKQARRHRKHVAEALLRKRQIKAQVREERRAQPVHGPVDPDVIEIRVRDAGSHIHFPATVDDIRAVLRRLPAGTLNGVGAIELSLGTGHQPSCGDPAAERDPFTGRTGSEWLPGIYEGDVLGLYSYHSTTIHLFAYVYAPATPHVDVWQPVLKLEMLGTLVHEVAHHLDGAQRTARGRWMPWMGTQAEPYAERMEQTWVEERVVPYLEATYGEDIQRLRDWVQDHGGATLTLAEIAGERARTTKQGYTRFVSDGRDAFIALAESVAAGNAPEATRLSFAEYLYWANISAVAMRVLDGLIAERQAVIPAMALKSAVYLQRGETARAEEAANWVLQRDATNEEAWRTLSWVYEERAAWASARDTVTKLMDLLNPQAHPICMRSLLLRRARAQIEVGDIVSMEADLGALINALPLNTSERPSYWERRAAEIRAEATARGLRTSGGESREGLSP